MHIYTIGSIIFLIASVIILALGLGIMYYGINNPGNLAITIVVNILIPLGIFMIMGSIIMLSWALQYDVKIIDYMY
jgi:hypothetical protein